jgi:mycothiol synthase
VQLRELSVADMSQIQRVVRDASEPMYQLGPVANEKIFGQGPGANVRSSTPNMSAVSGVVQSVGAFIENVLVGIAAIDGNRIRLLAVDPKYRRIGVGAALLTTCENYAKQAGHPRIWALGQAGNYLAPGIDSRDQVTVAWLRKRGWNELSDIRTNLLVSVRDNPLVTAARVATLAAESAARGYTIRRARADETELVTAIASEFGGAWPFEVERALQWSSGGLVGGVHVAVRRGEYCAFAAHDGNNAGLGWFGPAGTWPAHRGQRLGEAVLIACLLDVAQDHDVCEIAWIGPEPFYQKSCGIIGRRSFVPMKREFE